MALQMATNITPDAFAGVGGAVFDAADGLSVSWQVNGSPYLVAYQITINEIDDNSTQLYSTGKVTLASPFYGVLANGTVQLFSANTISAADLSNAGITNGNEYKMYITQWWGSTDQQSVTNQSAAVIQALSTPTVTIDEYPAPITERMYTFTATYTQAEGENIAWIRWILYEQSNADAVIKDTGEIYGTSQLQFSYDAFFAGTIYGLEVIVETQAGQQVTSGIQDIYISYSSAAASGSLVAMQKCGWNGVNVSWENAKNMYGTAYGEYSFSNGNLVLATTNDVEWETEAGNPISFEPPFYVTWVGTLSAGGPYTPLSLSVESGEMAIRISSTSTQTTVQALLEGVSVASASVSVDALDGAAMIYVTLTPTYLYVTVDDNGTVYNASAERSNTQSTITSVRILGPQTCHTVWIDSENPTVPVVPSTFAPAFTKTTYFLTDFENNNLNAGNTDTTGYSLYRLNNTTGEYKRIADLDVNQTGLIDYTAKNGESYTYQLWYMSNTIFTRLPFTSNEITPCRWNVILIAASQDNQGVYHPQNVYVFGLNVEIGEETNNNKSATQDTFTGYPLLQKSSNLYRSGKLTALIGKVDATTNLYTGDTADYADEIMALSTSNLTLFLRDRKGSFRLVEIKGAITQKTNYKWPNQAAQISIPWVEIGSTNDISVVLTNADALWPYDEIADTYVYIDTTTGHLIWSTPDGYQPNIRGSVLAVNSDGELTQEFTGTEVEMANLHIDNRNHLIADQ